MMSRTWMSRVVLIGCVAGLLASASGCVLTQIAHRPKEAIPTGPVLQVHAAWENRIMVTQDVVNNGAPLIGIAGRMYLFGEQAGFPLQGDGSVSIDLCDVTQADAHNKPKLLERWEIDAVTLKRLLKKDMMGWGYTLFLPWSTYKPDMTRVQLQIRYLPERGGLPRFSQPSVVTLRNDIEMTMTQRQTTAAELGRGMTILPPPPAPAQATPPRAVAILPPTTSAPATRP